MAFEKATTSRPPCFLSIVATTSGLKQYRCGVSVSNTDHKVDSLATLGHAEKLTVEKAPSCFSSRAGNHTCVWPPSAFVWTMEGDVSSHEGSDEASKRVVGGPQNTWDVFPDCVAKRSSCKAMNPFHIRESEKTTRVV
jgi:hypothetical protein